MAIPLKYQIDKRRKKDPSATQENISRMLGLKRTEMSLFLKIGRVPPSKVGTEFHREFAEACREFGVEVLEPLEKNFEGAETPMDRIRRMPRIWYMVREKKLTDRYIASRLAITYKQVGRYLRGELPEIDSFCAELFLRGMPEVLREYYPQESMSWESLYERISHAEWRYEIGKQDKLEEGKMLRPKEAAHFGFKDNRNPFKTKVIGSEEEIFISERTYELCGEMIDGIQERTLITLDGGAGSGKTTLLNKVEFLLNRVPRDAGKRSFSLEELTSMVAVGMESRKYIFARPSNINADKLDAGHLVHAVLKKLKIRNPARRIEDRVDQLVGELFRRKDQCVVLIVDEANRYQDRTLQAVKSLYELSYRSSREIIQLMSIIITGQTAGLIDRLNFCGILEEIAVRATRLTIPSMSDTEILDYIESRLNLFGKSSSDIFEDRALDAVLGRFEGPGNRDGAPRRIAVVNTIVTGALKTCYRLRPNATRVSRQDFEVL